MATQLHAAFLDLHGLHIKEACSLLGSIIQQRQAGGGAGGARAPAQRLIICTGAGKHSDRPASKAAAGGAGEEASGRLETAVERMLKKSGLAYKRLPAAGLFELSVS
jgi:hypothetical protein